MKKSHIIFLIGFVLILIFSIWLFTRNYFWSGLDLTHTGTIGDTIGGITSPIIGIAGSILVYVSFQAQLKANKMQFRALREEIKKTDLERKRYEGDKWFQQNYSVLQEIKDSIKHLDLKVEYYNHDGTSKKKEYKGLHALKEIGEVQSGRTKSMFFDNFAYASYDRNNMYYNIKYILTTIVFLLERSNTTTEFVEDAKFILSNVKNLYNNMLYDNIESYISSFHFVKEKGELLKLKSRIIEIIGERPSDEFMTE